MGIEVSFPGGGLSLGLRLWVLGSTMRGSPYVGLGLCSQSLGMRGCSFSHEALRRCFRRARGLLPRPRRRRRRAIVLDETVVKVVGAEYWLWNAVDPWNGGIVASYVSRHRSIVDTCLFLDRVLEVCSNKHLAYTYRGPWYGGP